MKLSRIVIERRRIDVARARGRGRRSESNEFSSIANDARSSVSSLKFSRFLPRERTRLGKNEMEFLAEDATPAKLSIGARESIRSSAGVLGNDAARECNRRVHSHGTSLGNYPRILSSNKRSRRCDGPLRSLTFPPLLVSLLTMPRPLLQQFESLASISLMIKEKTLLTKILERI